VVSLPAVVVKTGPKAGRRLGLEHEVCIGRQDGDLVLEDPEVSRRHAVLRRSGGSVIVEDLSSTNGTFVNGERIRSPRTVRPGDELRVGRTTLEVESDPRADHTIVSEPNDRADDTVAIPALPALPRQPIRSSGLRPSRDPRTDYEDATQPLPFRVIERRPRPARSNRAWLVVAALVLAGLVGFLAYDRMVEHRTENDFAGAANEACAAAAGRSDAVDLSRTPTRGDLRRARNIRLQALGAIRALERPEQDAELVGRFVSAFGETNASITRLESAIGARKREVAQARGTLRERIRDERDLATRAGVSGCGGLAFG
jgi:pSer/pThr/pTyr-binding forkhead associated (FHA) protein